MPGSGGTWFMSFNIFMGSFSISFISLCLTFKTITAFCHKVFFFVVVVTSHFILQPSCRFDFVELIGRKWSMWHSSDILWLDGENQGGKVVTPRWWIHQGDVLSGYLRAPSWVNRRLLLPCDRSLILRSVAVFLSFFSVLGGNHRFNAPKGHLWLCLGFFSSLPRLPVWPVPPPYWWDEKTKRWRISDVLNSNMHCIPLIC